MIEKFWLPIDPPPSKTTLAYKINELVDAVNNLNAENAYKSGQIDALIHVIEAHQRELNKLKTSFNNIQVLDHFAQEHVNYLKGLLNKEMADKIDPEDVIECDCYMIFCIGTNGKTYPDRVYRSKELAEKRLSYLNASSNADRQRGTWYISHSQLGS